MKPPSEAGNVTLLAALTLGVAAVVAGGAVDASRIVSAEAGLQAAADAAALEAAVAWRETNSIDDTRGQAVFASNTPEKLKSGAQASFAYADEIVTVSARAYVRSAMGAIVGLDGWSVTAKAAATTQAGPPVCVLTMHDNFPRTFDLDQRSTFEAENCIVFANSRAANAMQIAGQARASATSFCAVGGVTGSKARFSPAPSDNCTPLVDPAYATPSLSGPCTLLDTVEVGQIQVLAPGRYCNGLDVKGRATLTPGVYVFDDKPLKVSDGGELRGDGVVLHFAGGGGLFEFTGHANVNLSAPKTGPYAGLVMTERATTARDVKILDFAQVQLTGAAYMPKASLYVKGESRLGLETDYIAFIVSSMRMDDEPEIRLVARPKEAGYPDRLPRTHYTPRLVN